MKIRWNLTPNRRKYKKADVLIFSVGKSGRTWLRVLLIKYISLKFGVPFKISEIYHPDPLIPSLFFSHEIWSHYADATWIQFLIGKNICPDRILLSKKVILMSRDPRDVVVSLYFQKTRRSKRKMDCSISDFIRDNRYGIDNIIKVMNLWDYKLLKHPRCLRISYERLKEDPVGEFNKVVTFVEEKGGDLQTLHKAISFADFENMRKLEASGYFNSNILKPRDPSDPDSFKVRKGKVGGYLDYFDASDLKYLGESMMALRKSYGYETCSGI